MEPQEPLTVADVCARYRAQHAASPARLAVLDAMLARACAELGSEALEQLHPEQLARWRAAMPPPTRWQATQALKQVSAWALRWALISCDPLALVANPRPPVSEFVPLQSWEQVEAISRALPPRLALLPWLGAGCGLRPGELLGVEWSAIALDRRELHVRRTVHERELRSTLKTRRSRRTVPIRERVAQQIERHRPVGASGLVFATSAGAPLDLRNVRSRAWRPALVSAGIDPSLRIYDLRHTYATWSLRAGVGIYQLARRMGTSVDMIDATYGHLAADAAAHERALLDAWDNPHLS